MRVAVAVVRVGQGVAGQRNEDQVDVLVVLAIGAGAPSGKLDSIHEFIDSAIDAHRDRYPVAVMCRVPEFPERTF